MQTVMKALQQSGRTTHMVRCAQDYARKQGRPAFAVMNTKEDVDKWSQTHPIRGVIFCTIHAVSNLIDPDTLKYRVGIVDEHKRVFIDHAVIENRFGYLIDMLHQFDGMMNFTSDDQCLTNTLEKPDPVRLFLKVPSTTEGT